MTARMQDGYDDDIHRQEAKVDAERKAPHERPTSLAINDRINERLLRDDLENREGLIQELVP